MNELKLGVYWLLGAAHDYKRTDTRVTLLGPSGMERHYYRVRLADGSVTVANDSMLKLIEVTT